MAIRFRKSVKIAPGVRLNLNKKSVGISAGVKGARVSLNSDGRTTKSVGIPGTGIYSVKTTQTRSSGKKKQEQNLIQEIPDYKFCPYCGAKVDGYKFCIKCGKKLN